MFISLEGIDGAGKSTHLVALAQWWRARGREVVLTREPGGTPLAERLRDMVLHEAMDPLTESLLVFAARREHVLKVIEPALARGAVVLCDRFTDATFAYQGGGRGFDWAVLEQLERWVHGQRQPDLTFLFDVPPEVAQARRAAVRQPDRFEAQDESFFVRVRQAYQQRLHAQPQRFAVVDATAAPEAVGAQVLAIMVERAGQQGGAV
ncbi:MAG: dTMP kinase [Betaproteobacteria bacterium]|nr:dTMP kinase [Betaproteobacteria bacterium]NBT11295.1 dTMP kinase [Betaproteobacteria bacterium]NBU50447.1 dTMP kinase [Betaproteobacteria bacterium]